MADFTDWWFAPLGGGFLAMTAFCAIMHIYTQNKKQTTLRNAHEKVLSLRLKGVDARICLGCRGQGVSGILEIRCKQCGGLGYTYKLPPVNQGTGDT